MQHPLAEVPAAARRQADIPANGFGPAPCRLPPCLGRPATELRVRTCSAIVDVDAGHVLSDGTAALVHAEPG
jgi:hypothetical protein